jgi:hypothetical protein
MPISRRSAVIMNATGTNMNAVSAETQADSYYGYTDGLHTLQITYDQFVGRLRVQATLSLNPTATDWFDILPTSTAGRAFNPAGFVQFNANDPADRSEAYTFQGNFTFIRVLLDRSHVGDGVTYDPSYGQISRVVLSA